jgi:hypothetical protein
MKTEELKQTEPTEQTEQPETLETEKIPEENLSDVNGGITSMNPQHFKLPY